MERGTIYKICISITKIIYYTNKDTFFLSKSKQVKKKQENNKSQTNHEIQIPTLRIAQKKCKRRKAQYDRHKARTPGIGASQGPQDEPRKRNL